MEGMTVAVANSKVCRRSRELRVFLADIGFGRHEVGLVHDAVASFTFLYEEEVTTATAKALRRAVKRGAKAAPDGTVEAVRTFERAVWHMSFGDKASPRHAAAIEACKALTRLLATADT